MRFKRLTRTASRVRSRKLNLESLEHRRVLAAFAPDPGLADSTTGNTLRAAIIASNTNGEDDVITLSAGTYSLSLSGGGEGLSNALLSFGPNQFNDPGMAEVNDLDLKESGHTVTIRGAGMGQTFLTGGTLDRVFHVHANVTLILEDVTISNSHSAYDGGGLLNDGGNTTLRRVELANNVADGSERDNSGLDDIGGGGGVANMSSQPPSISRPGTLTIEDSVIRGNTAPDDDGRGGGIYVRGGTVTVKRTTIENNTTFGTASAFGPAGSGGGGIANDANLFIEDSFILNNKANVGAGIFNNGGDFQIRGTEMAGNLVTDDASEEAGGGAIQMKSGNLKIFDSYIHNNDGNSNGGFIWANAGSVEIYGSTIANNQASKANSGIGGAVRSDAGQFKIVNTTISGNQAANTGGIYANAGGYDITFSTIVNNNSSRSTYSASGAFNNMGSHKFIVDHTIIANNRSGSNPSGWDGDPIQGGGWVIYNGPNTPFSTQVGTQIGNVDLDAAGTTGTLNLGPLADNGGPVPTHALLEGSVAIDWGNNGGGQGTNFPDPPPTDARGVIRPQGSKVDVGAFEFEVPNEPPVADAGGPYTAALDSTMVTVDGSGSSDPDPGDNLAYAWDINNDGTYDLFSQSPTFSLAGMGINSVGEHTIRLRVTDQGNEQDIDTATLTVTAGTVEARQIFYNNSFFDNNNPAPTAADDAAIATNKSALLPGGNQARHFNVTSYDKGINGIMVDIAGSAQTGSITAADFSFRMGRTNDFGNWAQAPAPASVVVRSGAGVNGSDRVMITWADRAIINNWIEVTVLATNNTGLGSPDVFYFGNAIGDSGDFAARAAVNGTDFDGARRNPHNFLNRASKTDPYDFNRDSLVNAIDLSIVRDNVTTIATELLMISPPASFSEGEGESEGVAAKGFVPESGPAATADEPVSLDSSSALDVDVDGDIPVNQELLLLAAAEPEADSAGVAEKSELESAIDLIACDLLK